MAPKQLVKRRVKRGVKQGVKQVVKRGAAGWMSKLGKGAALAGGIGNGIGTLFMLASLPGLLKELGILPDNTQEMEGQALAAGALPQAMEAAGQTGSDLFSQQLMANDLPSLQARTPNHSATFDDEKYLMEFLQPYSDPTQQFGGVPNPLSAPVGSDDDPFMRAIEQAMR